MATDDWTDGLLPVVAAGADPSVAGAELLAPEALGGASDPVAAGGLDNYILEPDGDAERLPADHEIVAALAASGFAGPRYDRFRDELAKYAMGVLCAWMHSGYVFALVARNGFALHPTETELRDLQFDKDMREELARMIVAVALRRFREHALVGGGWRADGGASLKTYFMGNCLYAFPNEFRRHRSDRQRWQRQDDVSQAITASLSEEMTDPGDVVAGAHRVREDFKRMNPREQAIVALRMDGYQEDEIAEMLGENSVRAVEGVLYRLRIRERQRIRQGGE